VMLASLAEIVRPWYGAPDKDRPTKVVVTDSGEKYVSGVTELFREVKSENPLFLRLKHHLEGFEKIAGSGVTTLLTLMNEVF